MKKFVLYFNHFETEHLGKDVFLVPYYIGKIYSYDVTIIYPESKTNINMPDVYRGVKLKRIKCFGNKNSFRNRDISLLLHFILHLNQIRKIDFLMRFHLTKPTILMILIYKLFNKSGKSYVKLDQNPESVIENDKPCNYIKRNITNYILNKFSKVIDIISCETKLVYDKIIKSKSTLYGFKNKLTIMPNGFDEDAINETNIHLRSFKQKEDVIITVGRLGTYQKNTELLLHSIENINLKNWKVYLIGTITKEFQQFIDDFFMRNPNKKENVIFTGSISDKKILWDYYNRAKVFVLTSRFESYGLVLNEAYWFKDFIISTNVGIAHELINNRYGKIIEFDNSVELGSLLNDIINNGIDKDADEQLATYSSISWNNMIPLLKLGN